MKIKNIILFLIVFYLFFFAFTTFANDSNSLSQNYILEDVFPSQLPPSLDEFLYSFCGLGPLGIFVKSLLEASGVKSSFQSFISCFFAGVMDVLSFLAFFLAVISIMWAGILYITKPNEVKEIHKRIIWSIFGFIIFLLSYSIVKVISTLFRFSDNSSFNFFVNTVFAQSSDQNGIRSLIDLLSPSSNDTLKGCGITSVLSEINIPSQGGLWYTCFYYYLEVFLQYFYMLALAIGVIFIVRAAILYITKPEKSKEIHSELIWGIVGVFLAVLSLIIVQLIKSFFTIEF